MDMFPKSQSIYYVTNKPHGQTPPLDPLTCAMRCRRSSGAASGSSFPTPLTSALASPGYFSREEDNEASALADPLPLLAPKCFFLA